MDHSEWQPFIVNTLIKCSVSSLIASETGVDVDTAFYSRQCEKSSENVSFFFFFFVKNSPRVTFKILVNGKFSIKQEYLPRCFKIPLLDPSFWCRALHSVWCFPAAPFQLAQLEKFQDVDSSLRRFPGGKWLLLAIFMQHTYGCLATDIL